MAALDLLRGAGLLDAVGHAVIATDTSGSIKLWNVAAEELYGWTAGEAVGRDVLGLLETEPRKGRSRMTRVVSGQTISDAYVTRHRDGHRFPVLMTARPWTDEHGQIIGVVGVSIDATEAERTAASLEEARALAGFGIWDCEVRTARITVDQQIADILGVPGRAELSVDEVIELMHPDDLAAAREIEVDPETGAIPQLALRVVASDGSVRHILVQGAVRASVEGVPTHVGGVLVDVTEGYRAAAEVVDTLENLAEGYVCLDEELRFTFVNRHAEQMLGLERDDMLGRTIEEVFSQSHEPFTARYRTVLATGVTDEFESFYEPHDAWYRIRVFRTPHGLTLSFRNCTDERRALTHDRLTGLANRTGLEAWLEESLAAPDPQVIVCLLDLDRFRYLNDGMGHAFGDDLLVLMARRLEQLLVGRDGIIARTGGDEFVLAVRNSTPESGRDFVHRILPLVREPIELGGRRLIVTSSMGLAHTGDPAPWTADGFLRSADAALYRAKEKGGDRFATCDATRPGRALARVELEAELREALVDQQLRVVFQPSFDLRTGAPTGAEALVRWQHPQRGLVSPGEFIPIAEETGLIIPLGSQVLELVAAELQARPVPSVPFTVWVNVSIQQLRDPAFYERIAGDPLLHGGRLGLELTETMFLDDVTPAAEGLAELSRLGVRIAIDDFGTGYSSLARLSRYPFDLLKIDQSFIRNLEQAEFRAIVAASIQLGHGLHKKVIAEGVETPEQVVALRRLGCDEVSGFLLARPLPMAELSDALARGTAELVGDR